MKKHAKSKPKPRRKPGKAPTAPSRDRAPLSPPLPAVAMLRPLPTARRMAARPSLGDDERVLLSMLLLPALVLALVLASGQSMRQAFRLGSLIEAALPPMPRLPGKAELEQAVATIQLELPTRIALPMLPASRPVEPARAPPVSPADRQQPAGPEIGAPAATAPPSAAADARPLLPPGATELAMIRPLPEPIAPAMPPPAPLLDTGETLPPGGICAPRPHAPGTRFAGRLAAPPVTEFGQRLAEAARAQMDDLTVYTARYQRIGYPMGDLNPMYGACTDVVIRAYRAFGVDLQALVQRSGVGSGDPSIDHRRTMTLRAFFARHGESLEISEFPEDYRPGDIVTYYRPFSRVSRAHIAIVSDVIAPTGRPMIIHNRGWGVQLEDALFVDKITGHYRYYGATVPSTGNDPLAGRVPGRPKGGGTQRISVVGGRSADVP